VLRNQVEAVDREDRREKAIATERDRDHLRLTLAT
jgi:hypothetical protein